MKTNVSVTELLKTNVTEKMHCLQVYHAVFLPGRKNPPNMKVRLQVSTGTLCNTVHTVPYPVFFVQSVKVVK